MLLPDKFEADRSARSVRCWFDTAVLKPLMLKAEDFNRDCSPICLETVLCLALLLT
jgi:hypothetical protein